MNTIKTHIPATAHANGALTALATKIEAGPMTGDGIPDFLKVENRPKTENAMPAKPIPAQSARKASPVAPAPKAVVAKAKPEKRAGDAPAGAAKAAAAAVKTKTSPAKVIKAAAEPKRKAPATSPAKGATKTASAKPVAPANGKAPQIESKTEMVGRLLKRKEGCTAAEILHETSWQAVSVPQMAKANHLKLRKEKVKGQPTRYFAVA